MNRFSSSVYGNGFQMLHILLYFPVYFILGDFRRLADRFADEFADVGVK